MLTINVPAIFPLLHLAPYVVGPFRLPFPVLWTNLNVRITNCPLLLIFPFHYSLTKAPNYWQFLVLVNHIPSMI